MHILKHSNTYYGNKKGSFYVYAPFGRSWGDFGGCFLEEFSSSFFERNFPPVFSEEFSFGFFRGIISIKSSCKIMGVKF